MDATNYRTVYAALLDEINYRALCAVLNAPPKPFSATHGDSRTVVMARSKEEARLAACEILNCGPQDARVFPADDWSDDPR